MGNSKIVKFTPKYAAKNPEVEQEATPIAQSGLELFTLAEVKNYPASMMISETMRNALEILLKGFNDEGQFNDEVEANTTLGALHHCIRVVILTCQKVYPGKEITPDDILPIVRNHWNVCYCRGEWNEQLFYNVCQSFRKAE